MKSSIIPNAGRHVLALIAAFLVCTGASAFAENLLPLSLRIFPGNSSLGVDGVPAASAKGGLLPESIALTPGEHTLSLSADGYIPRELSVVIPGATVVEAKLERSRSGLAKIGELVTGVWPKCAEFTPDGRFIVCALLRGRGAEVFDAATLQKVAMLSPPAKYAARWGFVETAFAETRGEVWVSQMETSMLHVFRLSDWAYLGSMAAGGSWSKVVLFSKDEKTAYVSNWLSKDVTVIDAGTRKLTAKIGVGGIPRGMVLSRDGKLLHVCIYDRQKIVTIDTAANAVVKITDFGWGAARHIVLHPARDLLYLSDMARNVVLVLDAGTLAKTAEIPTAEKPNTIKLSPDGRYLFVSCRGPNNPVNYELKGPEFGKVLCIDTRTNRRVDWTWGGNQPTGLGVSPDGKTVVFTDFQDGRAEVYAFDPKAIP